MQSDTHTLWRHAALCYTGTSHTAAGTPCQDAWQCETRNGVTACAVSDGAGSAPLSEHGSRLLADTACGWLCDHFEDLFAGDDIAACKAFVDHARPRFAALAAEHVQPESAFAATLLCLALNDDGRWLALHLGDGLLLARAGDNLFPLSLPENAEFINETWFFTTPGAPRHTRIRKGNGFFMGHRADGFILCTDGVESALANIRTGKTAPAGYTLLNWLGECDADEVSRRLEQHTTLFQSQSADDGTLVILANPEIAELRACPPQPSERSAGPATPEPSIPSGGTANPAARRRAAACLLTALAGFALGLVCGQITHKNTQSTGGTGNVAAEALLPDEGAAQ